MGAAVLLHGAIFMALQPPTWSRRQVFAGTAGMLGAEAAWRQAVVAAEVSESLLPPGTIKEIEAGRVVVLKNWLPSEEVAALRADALASFAAGHFKADALASYGKKTSAGFDPANDRMVMPSFFPSKGTDGPWADPTLGDAAARRRFGDRMAQVKATLAKQLADRRTLAEDGAQTHEMSYTRYGPGASLPRHTDEHHGELKKAHSVASGDEKKKQIEGALSTSTSTSGSEAPSSGGGKTTRRSVTWLVYLNDNWDAQLDGGALRVHERAAPSAAPVGARGADLQIGWLKATASEGELPVFLDAHRPGESGNCCLYAAYADGSTRDLSRTPFTASPALYLAGGDFFARRLLVDEPSDAARFHLIDSPKSAVSGLLPPTPPEGEDGGERIRDVLPAAGTLVLFDSVSVPHEVMPTTRRERFACSGWFHERVVYS